MQSTMICSPADLEPHSIAITPFTPLSPYRYKTKSFQKAPLLREDTRSQAQYDLSLIEDPLWKQVCIDFIQMMGSACILEIGGSQLGSISPQGKTIDILCQTGEIATFFQQYHFVIIESLRPYFPSLKEVRVKTINA